jgi:threonylcarbamoyladenosine tRNA methylthiotransferase MtaB
MATFSIENFGCRATDADARAIRNGLIADGLAVVTDHSSADIVVLNTCTVTSAADSQAREAVRKIHRANPTARIIVTGCYAQRAPQELATIEGVTLVVGNSHQAQIPGVARELIARAGSSPHSPRPTPFAPLTHEEDSLSLGRGEAKILTGDIFAESTVWTVPGGLLAGDRTRPILKVQDGCNNRCSYCVIPFVRGRSRSLPPDAIIAQVRALTAAGAKEIVLSGINLGSYGRDLATRTRLADVVRRILDETSLDQLRLSSIEPQDVTEEFVELLASSRRLAHHFHIPLQSGSDRILRAMHRWYRTELYAERSHLIHRYVPDAAIGADVIVGFPGETDHEFQATFDFIEGLSCAYLHVFSFSARPGTAGASLGDRIRAETIAQRARALRGLGAKKSAAFRASQAGATLRALTLARGKDGWTEALTGNYLKVRLDGRHGANEWHQARVTADPQEIVQPVVPTEVSDGSSPTHQIG